MFQHKPRSSCVATLMVAAIVLAGASCEKTPTQQAGSAPVDVQVITIKPVSAPVAYDFIGIVEAFRTVEIRARVAGEIVSRPFTEGKKVKENDTLFEIDPAPLRASVQAAEGRLASAKARLTRATREVARLKPLVEQKAASAKELDDASTEEQQATASVTSANAELTQAQLNLSYATITAPFDGLVGKTYKDVGSFVDAGANSQLATLTQQDPIYVSFTITEKLFNTIRRQIDTGRLIEPADKANAVELFLADGTLYSQRGSVSFVDVVFDRETGTAVARAQFNNPRRELFPGQFVKPRLVGFTRPDSILVPQRSVLLTPAGAMVLIVNAQDKVEPRIVTPGQWSGNDWVIESGLAAGDRVIVEGVQRVQPGMTVKVSGSPSTAPSTQPTR